MFSQVDVECLLILSQSSGAREGMQNTTFCTVPHHGMQAAPSIYFKAIQGHQSKMISILL